MSDRQLTVPRSLWLRTWYGLQSRGSGRRETACVWAGTRVGVRERAREVIFLDDLPGTSGRPLQHRTSRAAVAALFARTRQLEMTIVADIHTHPSDWVDLSEVDRAHPIEYRVGLVALVLPWFAKGAPELESVGVHEYSGDGQWRSFGSGDVGARVRVVEDEDAQ